ncbi:hypothetical protein DPX16_8041 [Anabarilius grahami]|uniref:Uncharacterized protein n=1 Tax=Anabarilius grahami TaxID=495550 RepID=A0A3N0Z3L7_ANAGA|nr:hypothetical protein DPX16_8041 [Anabarilius grahami]
MFFKAIVLLTVWKKILQSNEDRNLNLQSGKIAMEVEMGNIQALKVEMKSSEDANQQETEENRFRNNVLFVALDNVIFALDTCFQTTAKIFEEFAAILKVKDLEEDQIHPACHSLVSKYTQDLTAGFENEVSKELLDSDAHLLALPNANDKLPSLPGEKRGEECNKHAKGQASHTHSSVNKINVTTTSAATILKLTLAICNTRCIISSACMEIRSNDDLLHQ